MTALVGEPVTIEAWARDDGKVSGIAAMFVARWRNAADRSHLVPASGPGAVSFNQQTAKATGSWRSGRTEVTFSEPGDYLLRARLTDLEAAEMAGHSQCCWTNGFVE